MSERKVLNKYFPPDFDPAKIPRRKLKDKNQQQVIRLMAPFSMRCNACGEYIYKGKKFNARKETALGEDYMGIKIFRFYIKCTLCSTEITFKTDPKNADYICEQGASRNFESWRDDVDAHASASYVPGAGEDDEDDEDRQRREDEQDAMKLLEQSTEASKREMEILDALQDIRTRNARQERASGNVTTTPAHLSSSRLTADDLRRIAEAEEDEALVRQVFSRIPDPMAPSASAMATVAKDSKGKGRAMPTDDDDDETSEAEEGAEKEATAAADPPSATLSIKRKLDDADGPPSLGSLLSQKGLGRPPSAPSLTTTTSVGSSGGAGGFGFGAAAAKKKKLGSGGGGLGIPGLVVKKKQPQVTK